MNWIMFSGLPEIVQKSCWILAETWDQFSVNLANWDLLSSANFLRLGTLCKKIVTFHNYSVTRNFLALLNLLDFEAWLSPVTVTLWDQNNLFSQFLGKTPEFATKDHFLYTDTLMMPMMIDISRTL